MSKVPSDGYIARPLPPPPFPPEAAQPYSVPGAFSTTSGITASFIAQPPPIVGGYALGPKFAHGTHYVFTTHYKPRWLTRKMMAWSFELHWKSEEERQLDQHLETLARVYARSAEQKFR